jgi:nitrite reductase/ring-hydroxylating ferredoxin subunit
VVTDIVVGSASTLAVLDVAEAAGARQLAPAADLALVTGISSAVVAAAAGITDWHVLNGKAQKIGFVHMLFNLTGTTLYVASLIARKLGNRGLGRALAFTAYGTLFGGAYLGGHLVFAKKIGVDHAAGWDEQEEYTPALGDAELAPNEIKRVMLGDTPVALLRYGGSVVALSDSCAHLGCSLAEAGVIEGDTIRCMCHGSRYRLADGLVVEGPSAHPQPVYDTRVRGGQIEIRQPKE